MNLLKSNLKRAAQGIGVIVTLYFIWVISIVSYRIVTQLIPEHMAYLASQKAAQPNH